MSRQYLNSVFEKYIERFEEFTDVTGSDENYKWRAVVNFQKAMDLNAEDFGAVLKEAKKASVNLTDSQYQQPLAGLVKMATEHGEAETIRQMFKALFASDGGNLAARQKKIDTFLKDYETLLLKYYPNSILYRHDQRIVMTYLWLYDPNTYYAVRIAAAKHLARCAEMPDEFGTYANFNLTAYHRFCDEMIAIIKETPDLLAVHQSRFNNQKEEMHPDEALHIFLYDLMFCAEQYKLYNGIPITHLSSDKIKKLQEERERAGLAVRELEAAKAEYQTLQEAQTALAKWLAPGAKVVHKSFGVLELQSIEEDTMTLRKADGSTVRLGCILSVVKKFVRIDSPQWDDFYSTYSDVLSNKSRIERALHTAGQKYEALANYLD